MKDTTDSEKITYDSRDPIDFLGIPVHTSQLVIQNGFYCPTQRL